MKNASLETFNPLSKEAVLNSPRSLEACRRQGILPKELLVKTLDEIKAMYGDDKLDKEGLQLIAQHYEERRREKLRVLMEERAQIMEDEQNGIISYSTHQASRGASFMNSKHSKSNHQSVMGSQVDSTLIDREKKQLERIKQRQEKEMKQMVEYETKMMDIRKQQDDKLDKQREREYIRQRELSLKRKEEEQRKREQEELKRQMTEQEEAQRRAMAGEEYRREQERAEIEKEKERQRKIEARKREEEAKRKQEEFVRMTEEKLLEQQRRVEDRKREMEERDQVRQQHMKEQQIVRHMDAEEKRRIHEEKLMVTKERNDELLEKKRMDYEERQAKNEYKRKQFEHEMTYKKYESKKKADEKAQTIKRVLEENQRLEEKKKDDFYYKKAVAEERKKELDYIAEQERQRKRAEEFEKEQRRKQIKGNMEARLNDKVGGFLEKMAISDQKVLYVQHQKEEDLKNRHALEIIKKTDKLENVQRIHRMQEYQRDKLLDKIHDDTERADVIKRERAELLGMRMQVRREVDESKRSLMGKFELVKQGKVRPESLSTEFTRSMSLMHSVDPKTSTNSRRSTGLHTTGGKRNLRSAQQQKLRGSSYDDINKIKGLGGSKGEQKEAKRAIENLKIKQNHEMLSLLEEEQNRENQREEKLRNSENKDRDKIEKVYAVERAKAHQRIQHLADSHDEAIRQLMAKHKLKNIY